jgi:hypothetical protein
MKEKKIKLYNVPFKEIFTSKRNAVILFLSLERRYLRRCKEYRELEKEYFSRGLDCH